jgi:HEPN domain-containing protein
MEELQGQSKTRLNREQLRRLAARFLVDARNLKSSESWASAYYLAGYAVECALKACIAKQVREHDFPDIRTVKESYTHDLRKLLKLAELQGPLEQRAAKSVGFRDHWEKIIVKWNESSRYENPTQVMAEEMLQAVGDPKEGVLPWLESYW